jgi:hypothetical protein
MDGKKSSVRKRSKRTIAIITSCIVLIAIGILVGFMMVQQAEQARIAEEERIEQERIEQERVNNEIAHHNNIIANLAERFETTENRQEQLVILEEAQGYKIAWLSMEAEPDLEEITTSYEDLIDDFTEALIQVYLEKCEQVEEVIESGTVQDFYALFNDVFGLIDLHTAEYEFLFATDYELSGMVLEKIESNLNRLVREWHNFYTSHISTTFTLEVVAEMLVSVFSEHEFDLTEEELEEMYALFTEKILYIGEETIVNVDSFVNVERLANDSAISIIDDFLEERIAEKERLAYEEANRPVYTPSPPPVYTPSPPAYTPSPPAQPAEGGPCEGCGVWTNWGIYGLYGLIWVCGPCGVY